MPVNANMVWDQIGRGHMPSIPFQGLHFNLYAVPQPYPLTPQLSFPWSQWGPFGGARVEPYYDSRQGMRAVFFNWFFIVFFF